MSVWYAHSNAHKSDADQLRILISTDGTDYRPVQTLYRYQANVSGYVWQRYDVDLSAFAQSCVRIALEAVSYGGGNQYIDSIAIVGDAFLQIEKVLYPQSVNNCQPDQPDFKVVMSHPSAQEISCDTLGITFSGYAGNNAFMHCLSYKDVYFNAFEKDTLCFATDFWEINTAYRFTVKAEAGSLSDSLCADYMPCADIHLQTLVTPPCTPCGDSIFPGVTIWNKGNLNITDVPVYLHRNDTFCAVDMLGVRAWDSLKHLFSGLLAPYSGRNSYELNIFSPLECDAD